MDIEKVLSEMTLEEKASLCSGADFWRTKAIERLGIPSVMMCDGPHGLRKQDGEGDHLGINDSIKAVCFPTASALACSFDRELLNNLGEILGEECQAENVAMLLGPGTNIKRSPLCGRNFEYFSEDPYLAGQLAASLVRGLQSKDVAACVKHFACNNQETRRMSSSSEVDERTLHEIYLAPFEETVKSGKARSIMCAYNQINGTYCSENRELLTDILRDRWGFDGFVVTDWGAVKDRVEGLKAGLDLEMPGGPGNQDNKIVKAVKEGKLDEEVLDETVRRLLKFIDTYHKSHGSYEKYDILKDHDLTADFAKGCAVLLKNENHVLPLNKDLKVAFIGEFAEKPRYQGAGSSHINVPHVISALEAAEGLNVTYSRGYVAKETTIDESLVEEAVNLAKTSDVVVIFAGLPNAFETEGVDRDSLSMPENQNYLIEKIAEVQPNTVVVLHGGSVITMPWLNKVPAVLNMFLAGDGVGKATVDLLFGDANPSGKLAETYPLKLSDNPSYLNFPDEDGIVTYHEGIYVGYRYYDKKEMDVLFPFGYGLSYTTFEYSDLAVSKDKIDDTESLTVTCKITNTGNRKGKEIVQLYVQDVESSVRKPVRELKEFAKVELEPGETKTVGFTLGYRAFAYYEPKIHDWFVESGVYKIEIGASSRDIRLSTDITVNGTKEIPYTYTRYSTTGDLMKTAKGRELMNSMMSKMQSTFSLNSAKQVEDVSNKLGEGSEKMFEAMMKEMPLFSLVNYGWVTEDELDGMIAMLNQ